MISEELQALLLHMEWADAQVWKSVLDLPKAQSDTTIRERLHHVHLVQNLYLAIWRSESPEIRDLSTFTTLSDLYTWGRGCDEAIPTFICKLSAADLETRVSFPWADQLKERFGKINPASLRETVLQIASHSSHHRGQINTRLRELGGEPPMTDFIAWVWMGKPTAAWPDGA